MCPSDLVRMALPMAVPVRFRPSHGWQALPDDRVGALRVRLSPFASLCVRSAATPELLGQAPEKIRRAQTPSLTQGGQHFRRFAFAAALFHPALELAAAQGTILLDSVLAQQSVHAQPGRTASHGNIERIAAPPIT